jgi:tellurite resistance protein TehA-like permease
MSNIAMKCFPFSWKWLNGLGLGLKSLLGLTFPMGYQTSSSSKFFIVPNNVKSLETQNIRNHFYSFSFTIRIEILKF